jgi:hypothetical protein
VNQRMKIVFVDSTATQTESFRGGHTYEVDASFGRDMIRAKLAREAKDKEEKGKHVVDSNDTKSTVNL